MYRIMQPRVHNLRGFSLLAVILIVLGLQSCRRTPDPSPVTDADLKQENASSAGQLDEAHSLPSTGLPVHTGIDFSWIPADAEVVAQLRVQEFLATPLIQQILGDAGAVPIPGGFGAPQDLETFTFVAHGLNSLQSEAGPPDVQQFSLLLLKSLSPVDLEGMEADDSLERIKDSKVPLFRRKSESPETGDEFLAVPEPNILLTGPEELVTAALAQGPFKGGSQGEASGPGQLRIWFRPKDRRGLMTGMDSHVPEEARQFATVVSQNSESCLATLDLSDGAKLRFSFQCKDSSSGQAVLTELEKAIEQAKQIPGANQEGSAMLQGILEPVMESLQATQDGSHVHLSAQISPETMEFVGSFAKMSLPGGDFAPGSGLSFGPGMAELRANATPATQVEGLPDGVEIIAATRWNELDFTSNSLRPAPPKLELLLMAVGGVARDVVAVSGLTIDSAELSSGGRLKRSANAFADPGSHLGWQLIQREAFDEQPDDGVSVVIPFHHPVGPAGSLSLLTGRWTMRVSGKTLEKQVPNLMDWVDNPVPDEDLKSAGLTVRVVDEGIPGSPESIQIRLGNDALLQDIELGDADSLDEPPGFVNAEMQSDGRCLYTIHPSQERFPDVLPVRFKLATALSDHTVTFGFQDLPIPEREPLTAEQETSVTWKTSTASLESLPGVTVEAQARWSLSIGFDSDGNPAPRPLEVAIDVVGKPAVQVIAFGKLSREVSTTDAGDLVLRTQGSIFEAEAREKLVAVDREYALDDYPPDGIQIVYTFDPPDEKARFVTRLTGRATIVRAASQAETTLADLLTTSEEPVSNEVLDRAGIKLKLLRYGDNVTVTMLSGVPEAVETIQLVDEQGYPLVGVFGGRSSFGGAVEFDFQSASPLPERVHLRVKLNEGLTYDEVPFDFENLPIPARVPPEAEAPF